MMRSIFSNHTFVALHNNESTTFFYMRLKIPTNAGSLHTPTITITIIHIAHNKHD